MVIEFHMKGYIHTDISPENIIIQEDSTPVLIDFDYAVKYTGDEYSYNYLDIAIKKSYTYDMIRLLLQRACVLMCVCVCVCVCTH